MTTSNKSTSAAKPGWRDYISKGWEHQGDAMLKIEKYLSDLYPESLIKYKAEASAHPKLAEKENLKSLLIRMPTGTGKTGLIALTSNFLVKGDVLVITPSEYLTGQVSDDVVKKFWEHVGKGEPAGLRSSTSMVPKEMLEKLEAHRTPTIFVCTHKAMEYLYKSLDSESQDQTEIDYRQAYKKLKERVEVIFVDEGHREPAKLWSKGVRSLLKPTILLSATPYRNDLRFFNIGPDENYRYSLTFPEAVQRQLIRDIDFKQFERKFVKGKDRDVTKFCNHLIDFHAKLDARKKELDIDKVKIIVRCHEYSQIQDVHRELIPMVKKYLNLKNIREAEDYVLSIHDQNDKLKNNASFTNHLVDVPKKIDDKSDAIFWIHQYKLTEGIDSREFCGLAFFAPFGNSRNLVQQIGRITRNKINLTNQKAFVLHDPDDELEEEWSKFIAFEKSPTSIIGIEEIINKVLEALPSHYYMDGRFRKSAVFKKENALELLESIKLGKQVNIFSLSNGFSDSNLDQIVEMVREAAEENEFTELIDLSEIVKDKAKFSHFRGDLRLFFSTKIAQSEFLDDEGFLNLHFQPSIFFRPENSSFLFYSGSVGISMFEIAETLPDKIAVLSPRVLESLMSNQNATMHVLSLINCDISDRQLRRREISARSLNETAPGLSDHFYLVSTSTGTLKQKDKTAPSVRRYINYTRSKLSDYESKKVDLQKFINWAHTIAGLIGKKGRDAVFQRYAQNVHPPAKASAKHILIDLSDFFDSYQDAGYQFEVDNEAFLAAASKVNSKDEFECTFGKRTVKGTATYDEKRKRFKIKSDDLQEIFKPLSQEGRPIRPDTYLSSRGIVRIITEDINSKELLFYASGHFYNPKVPLWGNNRIESQGLFHSFKQLITIEVEKFSSATSAPAKKNTFPTNTLFNFIETRLFKHLSDVDIEFTNDILICDDLGTEICDYIAVDEKNKRIALIHAKVYDRSKKKGEEEDTKDEDPKAKNSFSASSFQVISAQAIKNLEYLSTYGTVLEGKESTWRKKMEVTAAKSKYKLPRIRKTSLKAGSNHEDLIKKMMQDTSTQKEVWLVLGNAFNKDDLLELIKQPQLKRYNVVQLLFLIQSLNNAVSSVGARLRIFTG